MGFRQRIWYKRLISPPNTHICPYIVLAGHSSFPRKESRSGNNAHPLHPLSSIDNYNGWEAFSHAGVLNGKYSIEARLRNEGMTRQRKPWDCVMPCIVDPNSCSCLFLSAAAAPECCAITIGQSLFSLWACVCAGQWLVVGFCVGQYGIPERRVVSQVWDRLVCIIFFLSLTGGMEMRSGHFPHIWVSCLTLQKIHLDANFTLFHIQPKKGCQLSDVPADLSSIQGPQTPSPLNQPDWNLCCLP